MSIENWAATEDQCSLQQFFPSNMSDRVFLSAFLRMGVPQDSVLDLLTFPLCLLLR